MKSERTRVSFIKYRIIHKSYLSYLGSVINCYEVFCDIEADQVSQKFQCDLGHVYDHGKTCLRVHITYRLLFYRQYYFIDN